MRVKEFALGDRRMVRQVVGAAHEYSCEAEPADMRDFLGIGCRDSEAHAIRERFSLGGPAVEPVDLLRVSRNHALNGGERAATASDRGLQAALDLNLLCLYFDNSGTMENVKRQAEPLIYSIRHGERSFQWRIASVAQAVLLSAWHEAQGLGILYLSVIAGVMNLKV